MESHGGPPAATPQKAAPPAWDLGAVQVCFLPRILGQHNETMIAARRNAPSECSELHFSCAVSMLMSLYLNCLHLILSLPGLSLGCKLGYHDRPNLAFLRNFDSDLYLALDYQRLIKSDVTLLRTRLWSARIALCSCVLKPALLLFVLAINFTTAELQVYGSRPYRKNSDTILMYREKKLNWIGLSIQTFSIQCCSQQRCGQLVFEIKLSKISRIFSIRYLSISTGQHYASRTSLKMSNLTAAPVSTPRTPSLCHGRISVVRSHFVPVL